jgi:hypothetical protein
MIRKPTIYSDDPKLVYKHGDRAPKENYILPKKFCEEVN